MARIYRIRDTQRFIFLAFFFPLMPLLLQIIHPSWTLSLYLLEALFVVFTFWMLFRTRDLEVGDEWIRIDSGRWAQRISHEDIYEIFLLKHNTVHLRIRGRNRYLGITPTDTEAVQIALRNFAWRHAIPFTDKYKTRSSTTPRS